MFPINPAVNAAREVLTKASKELQIIYPDDSPEKINSGMKRSFKPLFELPSPA